MSDWKVCNIPFICNKDLGPSVQWLSSAIRVVYLHQCQRNKAIHKAREQSALSPTALWKWKL